MNSTPNAIAIYNSMAEFYASMNGTLEQEVDFTIHRFKSGSWRCTPKITSVFGLTITLLLSLLRDVENILSIANSRSFLCWDFYSEI